MGGISFWQLGIVLLIVILVFGTKKFRNIGSDLGSAVKGFKNAMGEDEKKDADFDDAKKVADQSVNSNEQQTEKDKEKA